MTIRSQSLEDIAGNSMNLRKAMSTHLLLLLLATFTTMSKGINNPPSLTGKPVKALVPPGKCQFTDEFKSVPLLDRISVSPTSSVLRFGLPDESAPLNLSTCACILAKATIKDDVVVRPYTPISTNAMKGCFDLLVKDYGEGAKMSRHLHEINVGDTIDFKHIAPNVKIQAPFGPKKIVMLVGGTGITPMTQALHAILGDDTVSEDNKVVMLYGSKVSDDILGREMIDNWAKDHADTFKAVHILSHEPEDSQWDGLRGYIDKERLEKYLPAPSVGDDLLIFVCGPPPMYDALCGPREEKDLKGILADLGYKAEQVFKF
jgi:cytochrome-b5 reductase